MKGGPGSIVETLRPVLDTYLDGAVGLTGCRALGLARQSCEYDVLVVGSGALPPTSIKVADDFIDLFFLSEGKAMKPSSPEVAVSLASARPVRDTTLVLSACISASRETLGQSAQRSAEDRLTASIKAMGRAEESISKGASADADFWLLTAGYEFAFAWLYNNGVVPAPSHMLSQLRGLSKRQSGMFEAFSKAAGLGNAGRAACEARLDSLGVVYDLKESPVEEQAAAPTSIRISYELLRRKSQSLLDSIQPADCYCFLGLEVARGLPEVLRRRPETKEKSDIVSSLSSGKGRLVSDTLVKALGIGRSERSIRDGLQSLRGQVSALTRKT